MLLISLTTLLMTAIAPTQNFTVVEDASELKILNPELKQRKSLKLKLNNGLEALIISDPGADQSAASLSVASGSWSDPIEYPGMAHFCEHMLFMGTEKYPSENEFFTLVSNYAGLANAYTAPDKTVYMFACQTEGFLKILDRFAHFFIDPLFNPTFVAKEMYAVDQEYAKNIENDSWREYMVFKETGNTNHPNRFFSTGNSQTLSKIPNEELKKWHKEKYGAEKMHLVIYSPLPLNELQDIVTQVFISVPQSMNERTDISGRLSSQNQIGKVIYIDPVKDRQSITLSWELDEEFCNDPTKSAEVLAYALKRGQKNSLYELLKNKELIDSMSIAVDEVGGPTHQFFQISLELTKKGIKKIDDVCFYCFAAIAGVQKSNIPAYLFDEKNRMAEINYQYQTRQNPFNYVSNLAACIADEPLSTFPRYAILASEYDGHKISSLAQSLTPKNCMIQILAPHKLTGIKPDRKEKWLGAEYAIRSIPKKWMAKWMKALPHPEIKIADPNPFLPENLALAPLANSIPDLIASSDLGTAFYTRSPEFTAPDVNYHIHILSPEITPDARGAVLTSIYLDHLTDQILPTLSQASQAGLGCSFSLDRCAIYLKISGFSEKAPLLLQEAMKKMQIEPPTPEQFAIYLDRHEKSYKNGQKDLAASQAKELLSSIVSQNQATKKEKLKVLQSLTYEDYISFQERLFESTYFQALFAGNLTMKEAESAWLDIIHALGKSPFPKEKHFTPKTLHLSDLSGPSRIMEKTESLGNATILLIDQGDFSYEKRASQEILSAALKEAFFNELRTKQKTGYIAQASATEIEERLFQYFVVQSNSHQPEELLFRFEQFIETYNDSLSEEINEERFTTLKQSLISSLKNKFRNLGLKSALWDMLAFEKQADFEFIEKRLEALNNLSFEEFLSDANQFLTRKNRKRLAILFEGKLESPFAYRAIELPQIEEIATYAPRTKKMIEEGAGAL